nr:leucine-rich repeat protein soc-2 homolog isoform X2 [Procambarus clarkii]
MRGASYKTCNPPRAQSKQNSRASEERSVKTFSVLREHSQTKMKPKFGNDLTNVILRQSQVVQTRMAGRAVIKVVNRCNDAKENNSLKLNLSHNKMSKLPEELVDCVELQRLDLSHNSYVNLPRVIFRLPKIKTILANNNYIMDVEVEEVQRAKTLEDFDIRENPLTGKSHDGLSQVTNLRVTLTPREIEEWEDLTI